MESIFDCKGRGGCISVFPFFAGAVGVPLWLEFLFIRSVKTDKILPDFCSSLGGIGGSFSRLVPFVKFKKEFKRLKMPNLSILLSPKKEKIEKTQKNYCKTNSNNV